MDRDDFKKILFKTAVLAMACDGEIHEAEIKELRKIATTTAYFKGTDFDSLLDDLVRKIRKQGRIVVREYFDVMRNMEFTSSEELLILEVALRIIQADKIIDENEERFMKILRRSLLISDEILKLRFGNIDYIMLTKDSSFEGIKKIIPDNILSAMNDAVNLNVLEVKEKKKK